ncbi:hypothetical protein MF672_034300 [Actinomadura sp. ATCC 31491]|uniref:Lipoprotein n=1 Tax=Actinomadura luzonensis TaxID=2805427 RepID=A0ABT0G2K2_9ACTN|nr:hypothetical protein [Actinomadura luzonensis]MCK2218828.1 hypothetical protein [Actinomadura luzonensis]
MKAAGGTLAVALALAVAGCSSPAWNDRDYELKAAASAGTAASAVGAARLAVAGGDRLTRPYLKVVLTGAAEQVQGVNDQFGGVQPPSERAQELGEALLRVTERAEKTVSGLLVQVRRDRVRDPGAAVRDLAAIGESLRRFEDEHG